MLMHINHQQIHVIYVNVKHAKPDQGNGVIMVNRTIYMSSLFVFINDMSKVLKLPSEGKLSRFLGTLNKKGFFSKEQYENIYPSGSQPGRLYGNDKAQIIF